MNKLHGFLLLAALAAACTAEPGNSGATCPDAKKLDLKATLDLRDDTKALAKDQYLLDVSQLGAGKTRDFAFKIANAAAATSARPLTIKSVAVVETDVDGKPVATPQFQCLGPDGKACAEAKFPLVIPAGYDPKCASGTAATETSFTVRFTQAATGDYRKARVVLTVEGDTALAGGTRELVILTAKGKPQLSCAPESYDFGQVSLTQDATTVTVQCTNTGTDVVRIDKAQVFTQTAMPLSVSLGGPVATAAKAFEGPAVTIAAGATLELTVTLAKLAVVQPQSASVELHSNDATKPVTKLIFQVNSTGACFKIGTGKGLIDFGNVNVGSTATKEVPLCNCGTEVIKIQDIKVAAGGSPGFGVDFAGACFGGKAPTADAPQVLDLGQCCAFFATYTPAQPEASAKAQLAITTDKGPFTTNLVASATQATCPVACVTMMAKKPDNTAIKPLPPGETVIPQTVLSLDASCSTAPSPHVPKTFKWTLVQQPQGSYALFKPSAQLVKTNIALNSAGKYKVCLDMSDDAGTQACKQECVEITVIPDDKIHVELTWDTPADPDKEDTAANPADGTGLKADGKPAGSDFDLHFAHPLALAPPDPKFKKPSQYNNMAEDPFFVPCYDCYLANKVPNWSAAASTDDNPREDLDDLDGWGPENVNMHVPEAGLLYFVGAYYYYDYKKGDFPGFGKATPRVRIYMDAKDTPAFDKTGPEMKVGDMWCVTRVAWAPNQFVPCNGADTQGNVLVHNYKACLPGLCPLYAECPSK